MIPITGYAGARVGVLGLGRSGLSAARALMAGGADVVAWDDGEAARRVAEAENIPLSDLGRPGACEGLALLVTSPGIAHLYPAPHPAIAGAMAAGVPVDNDIGLFFAALGRADWDRFDVIPRTIAITGSNGKSTTAALIHHILTEAGRDSQLGGNIGRGVLDLEPPGDGGILVIELSSYQTELARNLTPDIAVFTNLSPDHLDRHGGLGGYFAAKKRLFTEGGPDRAIIGVDEPEGAFLANALSSGPADDRVIAISTGQKIGGPGWSVTARKGFLAERRKGKQVASIDLRKVPGLPGAHNHQNACAAFAVARSLGLAPRLIEDALYTFTGLPHRSQLVADVDGVKYVNDSKATNIDAARRSLEAFANIHWIAGGQAGKGGFEALSGAMANVKHAYLIGETAPDIAAVLGGTPNEISKTLDAAIGAAHANAVPGDTVLLAPACASFDQFADFEARGTAFEDAVKKLRP